MISLWKLSLDILLKNAQDGDQVAQAELGRRYEAGVGEVEKDLKQSFEWYLKAAEQGNINAQRWLSHYYQGRWDGAIKDLKLAFEWLKRAIEGQDSWSCSWSDCDGFLEITSQDSFFDIFQEGEKLLSHYKYYQALEFFTTALKSNTNAYLHYGRGEALYWLGSYKKALESYNTALDLCPVYKLIVMGSFSGKKNTIRMLNVSQVALETLKGKIVNGKLEFHEIHKGEIDALIILLHDGYPITFLVFHARSVRNMEPDARAYYYSRGYGYYGLPILDKIYVEKLSKTLINNNTVTLFSPVDDESHPDCDRRMIEINRISSNRNREYPQKAHQEILTAFEMNKVGSAKSLANIVHGYLCVNSTENLIGQLKV